MRRVLVAGFGNELRGDDGFGLVVLRELDRRLRSAPRDSVTLVEVGMSGADLAAALLTAYDRLVIVDAVVRGGAPGTLYALAGDELVGDGTLDVHAATPLEALALARAMGTLPADTRLIGCEPLDVDQLRMSLSPPVRAAVPEAVRRVEALCV